jgi:hypothetical protein
MFPGQSWVMTLFPVPSRFAGLLLAAVGLVFAVPSVKSAETPKLTPEQERSLDNVRKGFGKAKKLQAEVERQLLLVPEANRVGTAHALAEFTAAKWPDDAPESLGRLVQLLPAHAVTLMSAAIKAAPKAARPLASAAMEAVPSQTVTLAGAAVQVVPAQTPGILDAASWRVPKELKSKLDELRAALPVAAEAPPKIRKQDNPLSR